MAEFPKCQNFNWRNQTMVISCNNHYKIHHYVIRGEKYFELIWEPAWANDSIGRGRGHPETYEEADNSIEGETK